MTDEERRRRLRLIQAQQQARNGSTAPQANAGPMQPPRADAMPSPAAPVQPDSMMERGFDTASDVVRALGSGVVRGATSLADLPGRAWAGGGNLVQSGVQALAGDNPPQWTGEIANAFSFSPFSPNGPGTVEEGVRVIPGGDAAMDYEPQTTAGEYGQTVGEFAPGALAGPGGVVGNLLRFGVVPGLASEGAGQLTEGTRYEQPARAISAVAAALLAGRPSGQMRPATGIDPESRRQAELLMRNGVRPTVGQATGNSTMRRLEGTVSPLPGQVDDMTAAAMRTTGSTATRANPQQLSQAVDDIVTTMDDATRGVSFTATPPMATQADDVLTEYGRMTAEGSVVPDVRNIAEEIMEAATDPNASALELATLQDWRSRLGRLLRGNDPAVRDAAFGLRNIIDDATQAELRAAGRVDDVARLATAREQYRNFLGVSDAATRAGAETGVLSPAQLYQSVIRSQGRRQAALGQGTDLMDLSRAGASQLRAMPTVEAGGVRRIAPEIGSGGVGAFIGAQMLPNNPVAGAIAGGVMGGALPSVGQQIIRSSPMQNLLSDPAFAGGNAMRTIAGILASTE